jgi:hypothetical protein
VVLPCIKYGKSYLSGNVLETLNLNFELCLRAWGNYKQDMDAEECRFGWLSVESDFNARLVKPELLKYGKYQCSYT